MAVKKSINSVQIVGTLKEMNISKVGVAKRDIGKKGSPKEVQCNRFEKTEFKNPAFVIEVNGNPVEVDVSFGVNEKYLDKDGKEAENPKYKTLETITSTYVCGETRVKVDASLAPNEYVGQDGEFKVYAPKVEMFTMTSSNVPEEDYAEGAISGIVGARVDEFVNEEETGRKKLTLHTFDYKGSISPFTFIIPADLVDDFDNIYETNSQAKLDFAVVTVQHGAKTTETTGFGRKSKRTAGYTTTEYQIIGGDEPFEEENEYFVQPEDVASANDEREVMIAKRKADKAQKSQNGGATVKGSAANATSNPFGGDSNKGTSIPVESPF